MKKLHGAILLELLLSMTLFLVVLWPLTRFLVRTTGADRAADTVSAAYLARERMEAWRRSPGEITLDTLSINQRTMYVVPEITETDSLTTVTIRVFRGADTTPLAQLTTRVAPHSIPEALP